MKIKILLISLICILSLSLISCNSNNSSTNANNRSLTSSTMEDVSDALKDRAKAEGVSTKEMEKMILELAEMTAANYSTSLEAYEKELADQGKTFFDEFTTAADYMGLTIKEYYEFEKAKPPMSQEDKDTMAAMNDLVDELQVDGDLEAYFEPLQVFSVDEVIMSSQIDNLFILEYFSHQATRDVESHYKTLLEFSDGYSLTDTGDSVVILGTYRGGFVNVVISEDNDSDRTHVAYSFTGDIDNLEKVAQKNYESSEGKDFMEWALFQMEDMIDSGDNTYEGIEYVVFMSYYDYPTIVDYYKSLLTDLTEEETPSELILKGYVNEELISVAFNHDEDVTYVQVNRHYKE